VEVNEFGACLDTEALGGTCVLLLVSVIVIVLIIVFLKGTTCMQRLRYLWGDSASVSMVSATSRILMPGRRDMILAEIR
jgi:hypothetical protein